MRGALLALVLGVVLISPWHAFAQGFTNQGKPFPFSWTRGSSVIASGGTSQQFLPANANRKALVVENPCSATEDLYVDFGEAALVVGSYDLGPCQSLAMGIGIVSQQSVNLIAATTNHAFILFEGN